MTTRNSRNILKTSRQNSSNLMHAATTQRGRSSVNYLTQRGTVKNLLELEKDGMLKSRRQSHATATARGAKKSSRLANSTSHRLTQTSRNSKLYRSYNHKPELDRSSPSMQMRSQFPPQSTATTRKKSYNKQANSFLSSTT